MVLILLYNFEIEFVERMRWWDDSDEKIVHGALTFEKATILSFDISNCFQKEQPHRGPVVLKTLTLFIEQGNYETNQ